MGNPRRFNLKIGPYEGSFREDPSKNGEVQFVRRRMASRQSQQHHQGCPCEACEETKRLIIEERSLPCGCKCQNCQQPIPTLKAEGPPLNIGTELSNPPQINGQPVANAKNKREPAQSIPNQGNGRETIFGPSDDHAIIDLAIAGESFSRIASHLGVNVNAVRERYDALVKTQRELLKSKVQQSGNADAKPKKPEKGNEKSNKSDAKDNKSPIPDDQKSKGNAKEGDRSRPRYTIPSLREHLSRPFPDYEYIYTTRRPAPTPPRNRIPTSSCPPWASPEHPRSGRRAGSGMSGSYVVSDTAVDEFEDGDDDGDDDVRSGSYYDAYRPQPGRGGAARWSAGGGADGVGTRGVRFSRPERMPRPDAVFSLRDIAALSRIIEQEEPVLWEAVARMYRRETGVWFNPVDIEMKFTGLVDD